LVLYFLVKTDGEGLSKFSTIKPSLRIVGEEADCQPLLAAKTRKNRLWRAPTDLGETKQQGSTEHLSSDFTFGTHIQKQPKIDRSQ
jgi:hypothetical protein